MGLVAHGKIEYPGDPILEGDVIVGYKEGTERTFQPGDDVPDKYAKSDAFKGLRKGMISAKKYVPPETPAADEIVIDNVRYVRASDGGNGGDASERG